MIPFLKNPASIFWYDKGKEIELLSESLFETEKQIWPPSELTETFSSNYFHLVSHIS